MSKRDELLERLSKFQLVPGHGPNIDEQTDEELEIFVEMLESMSRRGREAKREKVVQETRVDETVIYRYEHSIRIIASKEGKEVFVDPDELKWTTYVAGKDVGIYEALTLKEISDQLIALGYDRVFYVWTELGLSGKIYIYGNYNPPIWEEHGTTKGYA